jgi:hypothetical protein
LGAAGAVAGGV